MEAKSNIDYLSLFSTADSHNEPFENTRLFLQNKFFILFDSIINDAYNLSAENLDSLIDNLYMRMYEYAYGYSLEMFSDCSYGKYTHSYQILFLDKTLFKELDLQIKYLVIIMAYYTLSAVSERNSIPLLDCVIQYSSKTYTRLSPDFRKEDFDFSDFRKSDKETARRFQRAYNNLKRECAPSSSLCLYCSTSLNMCNEANHKNIGEFLSEFSFDLIVNRMQQGFNFFNKSKLLSTLLFKDTQQTSKQKNNFRREVRRLIDGMNIINYNFLSIDNSAAKWLYNTKREVAFHRNMLGFLTNENNFHTLLPYSKNLIKFPPLPDFSPLISFLTQRINAGESEYVVKYIISYLGEITIPVFIYSFFISMIGYMEKFHISPDEMKLLLADYLSSVSINEHTFKYRSDIITGTSADLLGTALATNLSPFISQSPFDDSFYINIDRNYSTFEDLRHLQDSIASAYYESFIQ